MGAESRFPLHATRRGETPDIPTPFAPQPLKWSCVMLKPLIVVAVVASALNPVSALAAETAVSSRVHYSDLDLGTSAGTADLDARIARKARTVCSRASDQGMWVEDEIDACRARAEIEAKARLLNSSDGARHQSRRDVD